MITKNLIANQLLECGQAGFKQIRGLITLNIGAKTMGEIKIFNVGEQFLPLSAVLKIGKQKFVLEEISTPQHYEFNLPEVDPNSPITMLLCAKINDKFRGIALAVSPDSDKNYADLFAELNSAEQNKAINEEKTEDGLKQNDSLAEDNPTLLASVDVEDGDNSIENPSDPVTSTGNFYSLIQPQLDELFAKFPHFLELEDLVANTEWVKVNYLQDDKQHYILGKLYDGEMVTHICYGIPADSHAIAPPDSLADYCQWLPLDTKNVDGAGYWVMYQSAEDGTNLQLFDD